MRRGLIGLGLILLAALTLAGGARAAPAPALWFTIFPPIEGLKKDSPGFDDFFDETKWPTGLHAVSAVKIYTQFVVWGNEDLQRRVYAFLNQHHIALAIEGLVLKESPACGHNVEGYGGGEEFSATVIPKIKRPGWRMEGGQE